jgi:hypothetical protein
VTFRFRSAFRARMAACGRETLKQGYFFTFQHTNRRSSRP